ncbi:hypothetical protein [Nocardioides sp.]|uniref:hypothetical protein n=1 Tax=Nocardioides sp. TaxID=35761 RepID=UPI00286DF94E|nr:hypothetical protein [Nocardioides sp.]
MALVCTQIDEWIEEQVSKPIEVWENQQREKCKDYPWYDPRGWVCWLVWVLVKVIRWVVVTVGRWVTRTVCKLVTTIVDIIVNVLTGLWDVLVGIVTLDWRRILDGLIKIGLGIVMGAIGIIRILVLCDTFDFIRGEFDKSALRSHVRGLLDAAYKAQTRTQIGEAIGLDHGAFGLRLVGTAYRTVLDSQTPSPDDPSVPHLVVLHEEGAINLRELCGFEYPQGFWNRKRYKTLKKGVVIGGGGGGEFDNPISASELDSYLDSRGVDGPKFIVLAMRDGVLDTKLSAAQDKGRQLGLILSWRQDRKEVTEAGHIVHAGFDTTSASSSLVRFLIKVIGRTDRSDASAQTPPSAPAAERAARSELCHPVVVGVFRYTDTLRGLAASLEQSSCQSRHNASGATFIDNFPDQVWKYVPIHELGHCFGLCHVDGLDRIMVSSRQNSLWSWSLLWNWCVRGEPYFTLDEAKSAWDYIVAHFDAECLGASRDRGD